MLKRLFVLSFLLISLSGIKAQFADKKQYLIDSLVIADLGEEDRHALDSLLKTYHAAKEDSIRIKTLFALSNLQDFNTWAKYNELLLSETKKRLTVKSKSEAERKLMNKYYASSLYNKNYYYSMLNIEDSCFKYLQLCIEPFSIAGDKIGLADTYNAMGVYYNRAGKTNESLQYYQKGLNIYESLNNKKGIARSHISIGLVYRDLSQFDKALQECNKALKIREELGDDGSVSEIWNYIGMIHKWSGDTLSAEKAYGKSLELAEKSKDLYKISTAKLNLGIIYQDRGQYEKAVKNYEESLAGFQKVKSTNGISYALNSLAITYNLLGQPQKALRYSVESHELCLQMGYPESLINSSQVLYDTYRRLGKYKEAFEMQSYHYEMKDSVMNVESQKEALTTQLEFESQKKLLGLEKIQEKKNLLAAEEKKQQQIVIISVAICLGLVIVFTLFLFNRFKLIRKQKSIIEHQNHIVTEKNKEILDSISYAKRLQEAILPSEQEVKRQLPDSFVYYRPKDIVAGDFYWMETITPPVGEDILLIAAADSTGHGVPGAMVSVVCSNALNRSVLEFGITEPGKILDKAREIVLETFAKSNKDVKDGMDISLLSIQRSATSSKVVVKWAGANNPLWYILSGAADESAALAEIKADKQPVGKTDNPKPFTTHTLELEKGSVLYLFTDGFADQFGGPNGKKFKYKPFGQLLLDTHTQSPSMQSQKINEVFENWQGELEQVDDVCIIGIRV